MAAPASPTILGSILVAAGLAMPPDGPPATGVLAARDAAPTTRPLVFASDEWCPYVCFESTQEGYLVELARALFETPVQPVEIRRMTWARAIKEAEAGHIDGVLGASRGESAVLVYPRTVVAGDPVSFALRRDDAWRFSDVGDLPRRRIGVAEGYRFGAPFDAALFPEGRMADAVEPVSTEHPIQTNLRKLIEHRIDTVLDNGHVLRHEIERGGFMHAVRVTDSGAESPLYFAFAATPLGRALARQVDDTLPAAAGRAARARLANVYGDMAVSP